jgi:hypothetical protein
MHSPWQRGLARSRSRLTSSGFRNTCVGGLTTPAPTAACASASDAAHQTQSPLGMRSTCVASSLRHSTPRPFECPAIARGKALVAPQNQACLPLRAPSAEPSDASRVPETPSTDAKCAGCACASAVTSSALSISQVRVHAALLECAVSSTAIRAASTIARRARAPPKRSDCMLTGISQPVRTTIDSSFRCVPPRPTARTRCTLDMKARARGH